MIRQRLGATITLDWVAANVSFVTPGHLSRLFRQRHGKGFSAYVKETRIEKAKEYLRKTSLPIREIARRVGYADPSRFTEHFKRIAGMKPSEFRGHSLSFGDDGFSEFSRKNEHR